MNLESMMLSDRNQKQTLHDSIHMKHPEQTNPQSQKERRLVIARGWEEQGKWKVTSIIYRISFWTVAKLCEFTKNHCNIHFLSGENLLPLYFLNSESITHLQETWKIQNKDTYSSTIYYNYFLSR